VGSKRHSQIIVRAIVPVDEIANIESQTNWPDVELPAAARIESAVRVAITEVCD
jgi:hypothetical protein